MDDAAAALATRLFGDYRPRLPPMQHQLSAILACDTKPPAPCREDVYAYLMDTGTGKSCTLLGDWGRSAQAGEVLDLLLIAPAGSYRNWWSDKGDEEEYWSEIRKHLPPSMLKPALVVPWVSGKSTRGDLRLRTEAMLRCVDRKRVRMMFVNIEALATVKACFEACLEFVRSSYESKRGVMIAVDESTVIKNDDAKRTKALFELSKFSASRRILSGLWTPKSPLDLFGQCTFLSPRILRYDNPYLFKRRYAILKKQVVGGYFDDDGKRTGGRKVDMIVGYQNLEELQQKVGRYSFRVRKEDCLDLPPRSYVPRVVPLSEEQWKMIQEIRQFGNAEIGKSGLYVTAETVIKQLTRLAQINCGYVLDDEERVIREIPEHRTEALISALQDQEGKAIVWCPWRPVLDKVVRAITAMFGEGAVAQWHGGNRSTRHLDERRFLNDPDCLYMVATQGAGMRGNTWTNASYAYYYANNYDLEQREQSEARNYRKGQKHPVTYVDFIAEGTNDWKVIKNLRGKIELAAMMNQEEARQWII